MNLDSDFPYRLLVNLGRREDRRVASEQEFERHAIEVERFPAIDHRWIRKARGFESAGRYALALTQRLAIRRARRMGAESVLLFEDDVVLHPEFMDAIASLDLPVDWGLFYFGCAHTSRPKPVSRGIVRIEYALDTHAVAIRKPYFDRVISALKGSPREGAGNIPASDRIFANLHAEIPAYAAYPNLAWQAASESDLVGRYCSNYSPTGIQRHTASATAGLSAELLGGHRISLPAKWNPLTEDRSPIHPAFLFLTIGDHNQPRIWEQYLPADASEFGVYSHPKHPELVATRFIRDAIIDEYHRTSWGNISLVRATLALLRAALKNTRHTHFILLSESCVPVKPIHYLLKLLELDRRSIMAHQSFEATAATQARKATRFNPLHRIPKREVHFQSQWMILSREAAAIATEDDFTSEFENMFAPDESYFATVLAMKGFPLSEGVRNFDSTWNRWDSGGSHPASFGEVDSVFASELFANPSPFARKFSPESNIGEFGLHITHCHTEPNLGGHRPEDTLPTPMPL